MSQENERTEGSENPDAWIVVLGEAEGYESFKVRLDGKQFVLEESCGFVLVSTRPICI